MTHDGDATAREAAEAVARRSYGRLMALLAARTRDLAGAEDAILEAIHAAFAKGWSDPPVRRLVATTLPRRGSGSADSSRRCCRTSPKRWACSR
jgi:predicted RNA polymerase sigma factor